MEPMTLWFNRDEAYASRNPDCTCVPRIYRPVWVTKDTPTVMTLEHSMVDRHWVRLGHTGDCPCSDEVLPA